MVVAFYDIVRLIDNNKAMEPRDLGQLGNWTATGTWVIILTEKFLFKTTIHGRL